MGNPKAFLNVARKEAGYRPIHDRVKDFSEVEQTLNSRDRQEQASRCMDCGVPFCHWACPLGNKDPEWNDALYKGDWERAYKLLKKTNPFPEFTGRICPALCEKACVLNLTLHQPVTNRENEAAIAERAYLEGYVTIEHPVRNGKQVAIIGAGPAGLAAANDLNLRGYEVTVFEKRNAPGGLLRYGIPNFKLNKEIIDRRINVMQQEGITFVCNADINVQEIAAQKGGAITIEGKSFDAVIVSTGTPTPRNLDVPGREFGGVHFALEILSQQNKALMGETIDEPIISAKGKDVLVIGGGDTGSDCIGTAIRQGAKSVTQIEIMPKPPVGENPATPWPYWPNILKTTTSHEEGCDRRWLLNTNQFIADKQGNVKAAEVEGVVWKPNPEGGRPIMTLNGNKETIPCQLVLLAMGFLRPTLPEGAPANVFFTGDTVTGPSLVVKAIANALKTAEAVHQALS